MPVPSTYKAANWQHVRIGKKIRKINKLNAKLAKRVSDLKAKVGFAVSALWSEAHLLSLGVRQFANEHRTELLRGGGKTVKLPSGGALLWEQNDVSLSFEVTEKEAVAIAEKAGLSDCIDREPRVNKTKVKEKLKADPTLLEKLPGFCLEGEDTETFRLIFPSLKQRVQGDSQSGALELVTARDKKAAESAD